MAIALNRDHIIVRAEPEPEDFSPRNNGRGNEYRAPEHRAAHGNMLLNSYEEALEQQRDHADAGFRLSFSSFPGEDMPLQSLEYVGNDPVQLLSSYSAADESEGSAQKIMNAVVYVPSKRKNYIAKKLQSYVHTASEKGRNNPRNAALVDRIASIRSAKVRDLWTDVVSDYPQSEDEKCWWEVWLINAKPSTVKVFQSFVDHYGLRTSGRYLGFADRSVILVEATSRQLGIDSRLLAILAELRKPHDTAKFIERLKPYEQREWVDDVLSRMTPASDDAATVCILDKGVQREHPLLRASLSRNDVLSVRNESDNQNWDPNPPRCAQGEDAHGTEMAGLALYGDLDEVVQSSGPVLLDHRLESVRILPIRGQNDPVHYADVTASATDVVEQRPQSDHQRTYMMAITSTGNEGSYCVGQPTSWSAAVDALSFGQSIVYDDNDRHFAALSRDPQKRHPRLFVLSAGNIDIMHADYLNDDQQHDESDTEPIGDPAQSWNALTVGAYANDDKIPSDPMYAGYQPLSMSGDLLATSRTSVGFDRTKWPIKPDVVAPGGNYAAQPGGIPDSLPELGVLTTRFFSSGNGLFTVTRDTSAATAQVAAIAARIQAKYPKLRPETVRALIVHSAEWTSEMRKQFKANPEECLRRYGMGVPDVERALYSASNSATLIAESMIHPFWKDEKSKSYKSREMNIHRLPWPEEALEALGDQNVRLRLTLSYFIEPNPSRRGWNGRYAYPSFGLRFALQRRNETMEQFRRRLNSKTKDTSASDSIARDSEHFVLSDKQEHEPGSIHSCIWQGPAIDIAQTNAVAIMPTNGWWKGRRQYDQSACGVPYSLVMSLQTKSTDVDLWTEIRNANGIAVPVYR